MSGLFTLLIGNLFVLLTEREGISGQQLPARTQQHHWTGRKILRTHRLAARLVAVASATASVLAGTLVVTAAPSQAAIVKTNYGFQTHAYGTRVTSETVALNMNRSAFSWIGCTRKAGLNPDNLATAGNYLAASNSDNNPWVRLGAVTTGNRTFTSKGTGVTGNEATSKIADLTLLGPSPSEGVPGPSFELAGLVTQARTWAKNGKLHGSTSLSSLDLQLKLPEGTPVDEPLGQLLDVVDEGIGAVTDLLQEVTGNAIDVPGLGTIRLGRERVIIKENMALARATSLIIDLAGADAEVGTADDSRILVGHSQSRINRKLPDALMTGHGYPIEMSVADDLLGVGKVGLEVLPCRGTNGKVLGETLPAQDALDGALQLGALTSQVFGDHDGDRTSDAWTLGKVTRVGLGEGDQRVELAGIIGVARVHRKANGDLVRSTRGTSIGSFTIGGEEQAIPVNSEPVELPGLGIIQFNLVEKSRKGIRLTAVRITLDPGESSQTVINLGNARTEVK